MIRVAYRKYDGSLHWHQSMRHLGEDTHGVWLGAARGMIARKGTDGPPVVIEHPHVILIPPSSWWTAAFNGAPSTLDIYADITSPPTWPHASEVTMIDLDLDVIRWRTDQTVAIVDQDEFAEHRVHYGYSDDVISAAEQAAAWLSTALSDGTEPFAGGYRRWLDLVS